MAVKYFSAPKAKMFGKFSVEKQFIEKHYDFIKCSYTNRELTCHGYCQSTGTKYKYTIVYDGIRNPKITVTDPIITYSEEIHMYRDNNSLCLHYPPDKSWTPAHRLYNTIIPWIHEWFPLYELFLITGVWEHDSVPHQQTN